MEIEKRLEDNSLHKFIILLTHANDEPIRGKLKLQKMMFVLSQIIDDIIEQSSDEVDNCGPYSEIVGEELRYMKQENILSESYGKISLTNKGKRLAKELAKYVDESTTDLLKECKLFFNDMTSKELLTYVYLAYPKMVEESLEYTNLKPFMEDQVFSLIKKEKITSLRAAELLHKTQAEIMKKMRDRGLLVLR